MKNINYISQWNESSKSYSKLRLGGLDPYEELVNFPSCLKLLGNIKGKRILDAGSGTGEFSNLLAARGAQVTGIDGAEKLVSD
ncbi:methyltransferase domain-containing protein [Candidatus Woesebacteria bacterium]|nr:MAG: methyltransferase domain-containing protein [Candidatus Woesebacteria bacterium]